jgi:hypothetical protein
MEVNNMMLIHALQDDRLDRSLEKDKLDPYTRLWHHYQALPGRGLTKEENLNISQIARQFEETRTHGVVRKVFREKGSVGIASEFRRQIHILEWRSALRQAGLEGSAAFSLTEKVLGQALNGEPQVRQEAILYLEQLENDICLIAQTKDEKVRQILIDGFGAQGEAIAVRNAGLEALTPSPPPIPNGTCQQCRYRSGKQYNFYYGRCTGSYKISSGPPASVTKTVHYYYLLGSFTVFFCGKCKWKYWAKQVLISASFLVISVLILWLLATYWSYVSLPNWLGVILFLLVGGAALVSLMWLIAGPSVNLKDHMIWLGKPKHLAVPLEIWTENEFLNRKSLCISRESVSAMPEA